MATIKSEYYRFNGVSWDVHYFKTTMDMVDGLNAALAGKAADAITSSVAVESSDYLVITDSSNGNKISRSNIYFTTSSTTNFLRNDGAWAVPVINRYDNAKNTDVKFNTASSYTLVLADTGTTIFTQASAPTIITVPTNLSVKIPIGSEINIVRYNSQEVTISYASGVIIYSEGNSAANGGKRRINAEYQTVTLKKVSTDAWILYGSLKA